jgi:hypothetical protein
MDACCQVSARIYSVALLPFLPRNLCGLTYNLYASLNGGTASSTLMRGVAAKFVLGFPLVIVVLAYIFDSEANMDPDEENGILNVARHSCRHLLIQLIPIVNALSKQLKFMSSLFVPAVKCCMRFSNMTVEWLLLRIHLLWSGVGIVVMATPSWWKIGAAMAKIGGEAGQISGQGDVKVRASRLRLLRIVFFTSVCLLLSLVITILIAGTLDNWGRSSERWKNCMLYEDSGNAYDIRDWDAYAFEDGEQVCSGAFTITHTLSQIARPCLSNCIFTTQRESTNTPGLECSWNDTNRILTDSCYCSCDDLSQVERPSVIAMTIAYLAQSLVVVIVGINMGLRLPIFSYLILK